MKSKTPPAIPVPEEDLIDVVTAVPPSPTCASDAAHAIEEKLAIEPDTAHPVVEHLIDKKSVEAKTVAPDEVTSRPRQAGPAYKLVRTAEKQLDE